jgi:hypothetical protein
VGLIFGMPASCPGVVEAVWLLAIFICWRFFWCQSGNVTTPLMAVDWQRSYLLTRDQ